MSTMIREERNAYMTRTIRRLWSDPKGRPMLEQILGPELGPELKARLDSKNPWEINDDEYDDKSPFVCRLSNHCKTAFVLVEKLVNRPNDMPFEKGVDALALLTTDSSSRQILSAVKEIGLPKLMTAGFVEFVDTIIMIHNDLHIDDLAHALDELSVILIRGSSK